MLSKKARWLLAALMILTLVLTACAPAATEEPATEEPAPAEEPTEEPSEEGFAIPATEEGKFNVAMVLIGPHDDGGWSQAHYEG
ncbi:MAG: hypothetical protein KAX24_14780, partial [Anaerolineae bacterium]|nr:hypothetical protein [Anaerolineae bacterium]